MVDTLDRVKPLRFPASIEDIDAEWISDALAGRFPGTRVSSAKIAKLIEGTASKVRYVLTHEAGAASGAPNSLWIKGGFNPKGASQGAAFANEVNFFRDLAPVLPINVPDSYYGAIEPKTGNGVVVLEDLYNRNATFGHATE